MAADPRDLCAVADVKAATEPSTTTTSRDPIIQTLITSASVVLAGMLEREFTPQVTATRYFRVREEARGIDGSVAIDLAPFDLASNPTTVLLHPEESDPTTLTLNDGYAIEPLGAPMGSYTKIRLSGYLVLVSNFSLRFGYAQLSINGTWGLFANTAAVDNDIRDACVLTVRSWLRQNPGAQQASLLDAQMQQGLQPAIPATWFVPNAALNRLSRWARWSL